MGKRAEGMERIIRTRISNEENGSILLDWLAKRFTYLAREQWRAEIECGRIQVNCRKVGTDHYLSLGDCVEYHVAGLIEPPVNKAYTILYQDECLLAVNKPANLPVHPSGRFYENTLWYLLRKDLRMPYIAMINRLDRETSGVVLIARNRKTAAFCGAQFSTRKAAKRYFAMVDGIFPSSLHVEGVLMPDRTSRIRKKQVFIPGGAGFIPCSEAGRMCLSTFRRISAREGRSLIEALPMTGRCHQLRATLAGLGYPVMGDKLYGPDESIFLRFVSGALTDEDRQSLVFDRQALHAAEIHLAHPSRSEMIHIRAPSPDFFDHFSPP